MATGVASRTSAPGRKFARERVQDVAEREAVQDVVVVVAGGTGDHARGIMTFLYPLHARIHILILVMLIAAFRLAEEMFSTHPKHLIMSGPCLG